MFLGVLLLFVCCILFFRLNFYKNSGINPPIICILFAIKIISGIALLIVYTYFYEDRKTGDVFKYLDDSKIIWNCTKTNLIVYFKILFGIDDYNKEVVAVLNHLDHWYLDGNVNFINDSRLIIRFNLLLFPFSNGNQYIHLVLLGLWSFSGQIALFKTFVEIFNKKTKALIAVFFVPSFIFWSSGILKEGILVGFLGFFTWYLYKLFEKVTLKNTICFISMWLGVLFSKFYVAFCLFPSAFNLVIKHLMIGRKVLLKLSVWGIIVIVITIFVDPFLNKSLKLVTEKQRQFINVSKGGYFVVQLKDTFRIEYEFGKKAIVFERDSGYLKMDASGYTFINLKDKEKIVIKSGKQNSFRILKVISGAKSNIEISEISGFKSLIKNIPEYLTNVIFRPFPNDTKNLFHLINLLENIAFIFAFIFCIIWFKKPQPTEFLWLLSFFIFIFFLFTLIGSTTPVIGAIVRYKIPALPFLWISILVLIDESKMQTFFVKKKNQNN